MALGVIFILASIIFLRTRDSGGTIGAVNTIFGLLVIGGGYLLHRWETHFTSGSSTTVSAPRRLGQSPAAFHYQTVEKLNSELCRVFYLKSVGDIPCSQECGRWDSSRSRCGELDVYYICRYPNSRKLLFKPQTRGPANWCPGSGGCEYFSYNDYSCALERAGRPIEFKLDYDYRRRNRLLGLAVMILGVVIGAAVFFHFVLMMGSPVARWGMLLGLNLGCFIFFIGLLIRRMAH